MKKNDDNSSNKKRCRACSRDLGTVSGDPPSRARSSSGESSRQFCYYHALAYDNLRQSYSRWMQAYGKISWGEYLKRVQERKETGSWVREVITAVGRIDEKKNATSLI